MRKTYKICVVGAALLIAVSSAAWANHDDSELQGLRVTVGSVDSVTGDVTITITATGLDSSTFRTGTGLFLGTQFLKDANTGTPVLSMISPKIPAIDWGDGSTLAATNVPLSSATGGNGGNPLYKGQFSHTYATAGSYTIRAFGVHVREGGYLSTNTNIPYYGNAVYQPTWKVKSYSGGTNTYRSVAFGVSQTATATLAAVPSLPSKGLGALAAALALSGAALLTIRRS